MRELEINIKLEPGPLWDRAMLFANKIVELVPLANNIGVKRTAEPVGNTGAMIEFIDVAVVYRNEEVNGNYVVICRVEPDILTGPLPEFYEYVFSSIQVVNDVFKRGAHLEESDLADEWEQLIQAGESLLSEAELAELENEDG